MKPPPFEYVAPRTLEEALDVLAERGFDAKILAGGQSLVPLLNFRLASPAVLVDVNRIPGLDGVRETEDGGLAIGALVRQRRLERDLAVARRSPLAAETAPFIAHPQIRNRGTVGGSLAHADPAAELPAVALAAGATMLVRKKDGERRVGAKDFYLSLMTTDLAPEEMLVEVELPPMPPRTGWAFREFARRHGDYALAGVAVLVSLDEGGACREARLVFLSAGDVPMEASEAGALLAGQEITESSIAAAAAHAAEKEIEPTGDIHASEDYKRHLAAVLARRALRAAAERARAGDGAGA